MTTTKKTLLVAIPTATILAVGIAYYYLADPATATWMPKCPWRLLTGTQCPGCGAQRALHALLHGHPLEALRHNYFFTVSLPLLAAAVVAEGFDRRQRLARLQAFVHHRYTLAAYVALTAAWWVGRNLLGL